MERALAWWKSTTAAPLIAGRASPEENLDSSKRECLMQMPDRDYLRLFAGGMAQLVERVESASENETDDP